MNRIDKLFASKGSNILNVYFTAGHPELNDTISIVNQLEIEGVDMVEIGMPYSDPLADGPTIQNSSQVALKNGMSLATLFDQIKKIRATSQIPIILMGYFNQMMQYGERAFLESVSEAGVDGLIIPDLPMDIYESDYKEIFDNLNLRISFLVTPETSDYRLRQADRLSSGFLYVVSKSSITGSSSNISDNQRQYFQHLDHLGLQAPKLIGFGIYNNETFQTACSHACGAIIGSAFIRVLDHDGDMRSNISQFIRNIKE